jgi:phage terminase small subunit
MNIFATVSNSISLCGRPVYLGRNATKRYNSTIKMLIMKRPISQIDLSTATLWCFFEVEMSGNIEQSS